MKISKRMTLACAVALGLAGAAFAQTGDDSDSGDGLNNAQAEFMQQCTNAWEASDADDDCGASVTMMGTVDLDANCKILAACTLSVVVGARRRCSPRASR